MSTEPAATSTVQRAARRRPRSCVACRSQFPKEALVRVVRAPTGEMVLDATGKLPGRGAYLCPNRSCLEKARKTGALARALGTQPQDACWEALTRQIERAVAQAPEAAARELASLLGLSRRAGLTTIGVEAIRAGEAKRKKDKNLCVLLAQDCSEATRRAAEEWDAETLPLDREALSSALGASNVQALAVRGGLAERIRRLLRQCQSDGSRRETCLEQ